MKSRLLKVNNLRTCFHTSEGKVPAVDGVNFHLNKGEIVAIVGESGSGKSVTALSIMNSIPSPPGSIEAGEIIFNNEDILEKSEKEMRKIRGNEISMIFQDPGTALNPVFTIGRQISESLELHKGLSRKEGKKQAVELLRMVGIPSPKECISEYPHQLSGGMKQRVMIAMALSCKPELLIADEPTTGLDVTIQAQILEIMKDLKEELEMAILIITHDLGVVAEMSERVVVMYAGKVVEIAEVKDLFKHPKHPYTRGLLASIPSLTKSEDRLNVIGGSIPEPTELSEGCSFYERCEYAKEICKKEEPSLRNIADNRYLSCWIDTKEYISEVVV
ncbi:ABC transporter ATP-binding protein [Acetohalobium arabaticum]|uniref:Oligopeptide/dipeptide ABC transporter, ATPase subunit n=1 Tax=Acetohalobium arabaticum (strain ATCC 49924 / DSM 5501 / Z-7288) TaxID=574087 RepID=D9QVB4_ACEAZ|nr:ABC transporter ATP-binding protein [Acetohalobium arabaticum]ADL12173.1 oligopeptide/dipeptide ABC transporter, ATPase subunit [Acetohalobium arabaticum DSM 5501]